MEFETSVRNQFTFSTNDKKFGKLLFLSAKNEINIAAVIFVRDKHVINIKVVVGSPNPYDYEIPQKTELFKNFLKKLKISYEIDPVIQILNIESETGTPGNFGVILNLLLQNKIKVLASYYGEPKKGEIVSVFYQVRKNKIKAAKNIIESVRIENMC